MVSLPAVTFEKSAINPNSHGFSTSFSGPLLAVRSCQRKKGPGNKVNKITIILTLLAFLVIVGFISMYNVHARGLVKNNNHRKKVMGNPGDSPSWKLRNNKQLVYPSKLRFKTIYT